MQSLLPDPLLPGTFLVGPFKNFLNYVHGFSMSRSRRVALGSSTWGNRCEDRTPWGF